MNDLQKLPIDKHGPVLVTLNPPFEVDADKTVGRYQYEHPMYSAAVSRCVSGLDVGPSRTFGPDLTRPMSTERACPVPSTRDPKRPSSHVCRRLDQLWVPRGWVHLGAQARRRTVRGGDPVPHTPGRPGHQEGTHRPGCRRGDRKLPSLHGLDAAGYGAELADPVLPGHGLPSMCHDGSQGMDQRGRVGACLLAAKTGQERRQEVAINEVGK